MASMPLKNLKISKGESGGTSAEDWKRAFQRNLFYVLGRFPATATANDNYLALAYSVRDHLLDRWVKTSETYYRKQARTVCYLSAEFLLGPHLGNNLLNLGALDTARQAMEELGLDFEELLEQEEEPGLGNGGLGRLAACYLDSLATLEIPAIGYGIRYEFGIFDQQIRDGWQVEMADKWLRLGNPWEIPRPEIAIDVGFGGHTEHVHRRERPLPRPLDSRAARQGHRPRYADPRLSGQHGQPAPPVERGSGQFIRLRVVQHR